MHACKRLQRRETELSLHEIPVHVPDPERDVLGGKMTIIYKICTAAEWREAERSGVYEGSVADRRDGFIHFSTAEQAPTTAAKHFAGQPDLVLVSVEAAILGDRLKWEPSRGGALFPHLYGPLQLKAVQRVIPLPIDPS